MAKQFKDLPIGQNDLLEYLEGDSDFSFELEVFKELVDRGFYCSHNGTYDDPATKTPREYDIRAHKNIDSYYLRMAVECKNLKQNYPLLVTSTCRTEYESLHNILIHYYSQQPQLLHDEENIIITISPSEYYCSGDFIGKSCAQVGRLMSNNSISSSDAEVYNKWSQAISSAYGLLQQGATLDMRNIGGEIVLAVIPILVVPDNMLWIVRYNDDGTLNCVPFQTDHCHYKIMKNYSIGYNNDQETYTINCLEIMTKSGFSRYLDRLCDDTDDLWSKIFPQGEIELKFAQQKV